jgi:hypothetical protein
MKAQGAVIPRTRRQDTEVSLSYAGILATSVSAFSLFGMPALVVIGTPDFALLDLGLHSRPGIVVPVRRTNNKVFLASHVIELQHHRICLAAVHTWVIRQMCRNSGPDDSLGLLLVDTNAVFLSLLVPIVPVLVNLYPAVATPTMSDAFVLDTGYHIGMTVGRFIARRPRPDSNRQFSA